MRRKPGWNDTLHPAKHADPSDSGTRNRYSSQWNVLVRRGFHTFNPSHHSITLGCRQPKTIRVVGVTSHYTQSLVVAITLNPTSVVGGGEGGAQGRAGTACVEGGFRRNGA